MKLTIEHLAPYLPYGVMIKTDFDETPKKMSTGQGSSTYWVGIKTTLNAQLKPILWPMSSINYHWEDLESKFNTEPNAKLKYGVSPLRFSFEYFEGNYYEAVGQEFWQELFRLHLDVFGLIDKGLAIDKSKL